MRYFILCFCIILTISTGHARAQSEIKDTPRTLEKQFSRLSKYPADNERLRINDSIRSIIDSYVRSDTVLKHRFNNIRNLGQITSPDNLIKIVTWNLVLDSGQSRYYCYFIRKAERGKINKVYALSAPYRDEPIRTDTIYYQKNWYGALYYDIKPCPTDNNISWVLLGINYSNPLVSTKMIDVLSFTPEDSIIFGRKWFVTGEDVRFRDVFQYSSTGIMSLRFKTDKSIIFDHLVPISPEYANDRQYYGSHYSFDAYNFKNGLWKLSVNVDVRNKK